MKKPGYFQSDGTLQQKAEVPGRRQIGGEESALWPKSHFLRGTDVLRDGKKKIKKGKSPTKGGGGRTRRPEEVERGHAWHPQTSANTWVKERDWGTAVE